MSTSVMTMTNSIEKRLNTSPIVPLIQSGEPAVAIEIAKALVAGGLPVIEVVLRTPQALNCLAEIKCAVPDAIVGAGTVLSEAQAEAAITAGAEFIVSPGLSKMVVDVAMAHDLPIFPGVATATEVQRAWNMGLRALKFFPAEQMGGIPTIKSLSAVFGDVSFMPTGGVSAANLATYLSVPAVLACGGSWLTPRSVVDNGDFDTIKKLAKEAVAIAAATRG